MSVPLSSEGEVIRVAGPVVGVRGLENARLYDVVQVGELGLIGEIIHLAGDQATIQVYEETSGLHTGEVARSTGMGLAARLGPGLLGSVFDGLQRPLNLLADQSGDFIHRGISAPPLPQEQLWEFTPLAQVGDWLTQGDVLGTVQETQSVLHRVMVPPGIHGGLVELLGGRFRVDDVVAVLEQKCDGRLTRHEVSLSQVWPVRKPRPVIDYLKSHIPLISGTRVIDALFPVAKGGTAIIPGGFGTGKTVLEHSLASWADTDVVVYIGCGERGNEMAEVLEDFPKLVVHHTGLPLMQRTVLIANTSNMPVAAREASIYMGITIAEYYRDMGYHTLLLADSTSRWGEALREISGRLEEMPGEEGFPAYLATRICEVYERAGLVTCLGERTGSVTVIGAISPPGGDFSEPMTQNSMRVAGTFWALDYDLSRRRHFPAINWLSSFSLYKLDQWYQDNQSSEWAQMKQEAQLILQQEAELIKIIQLVGPDALPEKERLLLLAAQMLRQDFLQQSAYDEVDRFCTLDKAYWMLKVILAFYQHAQQALERGMLLEQIDGLPVRQELARIKEIPADIAADQIQALMKRVDDIFKQSGGH